MTKQATSHHKLFELVISLGTWLFVLLVTLHLWETDDPAADYRLLFSLNNLALVSTLFLLNITAALWRLFSQRLLTGLMLLETLSLLLLLFLFPNGIVIFLGIMLVAQLNDYVHTFLCFLFASLLPVGYFFQLPAEHAWFNVILFCLLNYFAMYVFNRLIAERKSKNEHAQLLRELKATQSLLSSTSKRDERQRIARDLHDLLGHHLTALSLQLEIAAQLSRTETVPSIQKAQNIAENLLNNVREAVSTIRSNNPLDITAALSSLIMDNEYLDIQLNIAADLNISNTRLAELILRVTQEAITNILKHSQATHCQIQLEKQGDKIILKIQDNGKPQLNVLPGNGLTGMAERVEAMDGHLNYRADTSGFSLTALIPEPL